MAGYWSDESNSELAQPLKESFNKMQLKAIQNARQRGYAMVTVIMFIAITSTLLAGVSTFAASHNMRAHSDADWQNALDIAEAGINTELAKISRNHLIADITPTTYTFNGGIYRVWITQRNSNGTETTPWTAPNDMYIYSTGTYDGVSRTLKVSVKGNIVDNTFALYGVGGANLTGNVDIVGNVGTNGTVAVSGTSDISGNIELNGPTANISGGTGLPTRNPAPKIWPTVDEIANDTFLVGGGIPTSNQQGGQSSAAIIPSSNAYIGGRTAAMTGMQWLALHNDNARVGLPALGAGAIISNSITLVGPGNYFVSSVLLSGSKQIRFDNKNGPINLWLGPTNGLGAVYFAGTTDAQPTGLAGAHEVNMYVAVKYGVTFVGTSTFRGNIYCYNRDPITGAPFGDLRNSGTPIIYGTVVCNQAILNGTTEIQFRSSPTRQGWWGYYGFDDSWTAGRMVNGQWLEGENPYAMGRVTTN